MNAAVSVFRGYHGIKEILDEITPLVDFILKYKPSLKHMTLNRKSYDLIARWPKAGAMHGFEYSKEGIVSYKGIVLGYDKRPGRYSESTSASEQET